MNQLTTQELEAIRERIDEIWFYKAYVKGDPWKGYEVRCANIGQLIAETSSKIDADFIANARTDIPKLLAEVDRLRKAIDNAASLLPDGENRLANRYLCEALGADENNYGFFGEEGD